ncbi:FecR family protein [Saccharicrinis fermentans]|uniref:Fec operon regulator FecR n=1 Tax=Saccharicrinis fermentans DSM 9555 = JCM 21142 TaxID=869213 RepID=W7Y2U4_9BACT|nr:FecR domain-containing protein [Saccharicrinis fermentans]GAF05145.1 fec operon regulator FecR [Saccharicrinis fermentans DSM 9555 = JCM 21142]
MRDKAIMMNDKLHINWDLAAKVYSGEASQDEVRDFEKWMEEGSHRNEWRQISDNLHMVDHTLVGNSVDLHKAWDDVRAKTLGKQKRYVHLVYAAYGAAVACVIALLILFVNPFSNDVGNSKLITAKSDEAIEIISLNDGSVIDLNRNSSIEYLQSFGKDDRSVSLYGEAFFHVAADTTRPFVIHTSQIQIKVVGTSFNVKAFADALYTEVSVNSGEVEVSSLLNVNNQVVLRAGDRAVFNVKDHSLVKMQVDNDNYMAWKTKKFVFKRDKLAEAIVLIEEVYDVTIEIPEGLDVENHVISSTFDRYDIAHVMDVLNELYGVDFHYHKN